MSENDLDNLLESVDLEDVINELETSAEEDTKPIEKEDTKPGTEEDTKPIEKEDTKPGPTDTAVGVQVGGANTVCAESCGGP